MKVRKMLSTNVLCIKKKKKKSYCFASGGENGGSSVEKNKRFHGGPTMLQITEDTPPDMLAGAMDLTVHLPTGKAVKMSVERSTPMMDLLMQITTNYHLQLSGYTLQALGMAPSKEHSDHILPYKPNTPIGALDTQHIKVVPKTRQAPLPKNVPVGRQPFESTFRLKVHLPRNQLYVTRVSQSVYLEDIMKKVCEEKNLDPLKYEFRHPGNLDQILDSKLTLSDYAITEIYLVQKGTGNLNQFSSNDIMALRKEEERKQMHNKTGGGVFNLIFRKGKSSTGSLSSDNRSISPTQSDDSRSVTPPAVQPVILEPAGDERPKPPQRKRRPAPKPPQEPPNPKPEASLTICHSRNSSDSSGYHEASLLSENCNASLPRRPKSSVINEETQQNLSKMAAHSKSTSSLAFPSRKKKTAPPPPPVLKPEKSNLEEPSPVVASQPCTVVEASTESVLSAQQTPADSLPPEEPEKSKVPEPESEPEPEPKEDTSVKELDWQYQLPSPPKDFRDLSPVNFLEEKQQSVVDSVVTSPELFEKLKTVKDQSEKETVSDITSVVSEEERPLLNKLSLENLEKRKSLVYNRELATSLKMSDKERKPDAFTNSLSNNFQKVKVAEERKPDVFTNLLANFQKTYNEVKNSNSSPKQSSTLPNFKITTYDPKKKIDIFEDDTIRSNEKTNKSGLHKPNFGRSMENISFMKNNSVKKDEFNQEYTFFRPPSSRPNSVFRSESFTKEQWVPSKPVMRSKSQVALNKYNADARKAIPDKEESLSKSSSLFDVSGLQSLEVMRLIQTKLNSPNTSSEQISKEPNKEPPPPKVERYRRPSINMSTWSERPKVPVNVKEDPDYKFSNKSVGTSKLIVTTTNSDVKSHNSIEVRNKTPLTNFTNTVSVRVNHDVTDRNVNIKFNNAANQGAGNVVIKIGANDATNRLRRPLSNVNGESQRPHSIAFGGDFDISRVPIVRSVELKKPYKDQGNNNTSVTQIFHEEKRPIEVKEEQKPVFRVNALSYSQKAAPVVRGFTDAGKQWNQSRSFSTLPTKPKNYSLNAPIPFSQSNLRRTESTHVEPRSVPPLVPIMPKTVQNGIRDNSGADPKEQLLQAIRDFGGKKGLRAVKA